MGSCQYTQLQVSDLCCLSVHASTAKKCQEIPRNAKHPALCCPDRRSWPGKCPIVSKSLKRTALAWLLPFHAEVLASAAASESCLPAVPSGELFACLHLDPGMALLLGRLSGVQRSSRVAKPVLLLPSGAERGRAGGSAMVSFHTFFFSSVAGLCFGQCSMISGRSCLTPLFRKLPKAAPVQLLDFVLLSHGCCHLSSHTH